MILGSEKPGPDIESKEFGTFAKGSDCKLCFTATTTVPLIPHHRFGWRLKLDAKHRGPIEVREELERTDADAAVVGSRPISSPPPLLEEELRSIRATLARYHTALTWVQGGLEIFMQQQCYTHEHGDAQSRAYADESVRRTTNEMETIEFCMTQL